MGRFWWSQSQKQPILRGDEKSTHFLSQPAKSPKSWCGKRLILPSGKRLQKAIEAMAIEIADFPMKHGDFP